MNVNEKRSTATRQRKSTLTQQQKNKKRQRATPKQLSVLRNEFMINSTPNAKIREEIGQKIDMTERSVQIWFQNKRAKAKQFARRNHNPYANGRVPYMANANGPQAFYANMPLFSPIASPLAQTPYNGAQPGNNYSAYPTGTNMGVSNKISLPCTSIKIGSWQRISSSEGNDLHVSYSSSDNSLSYTMFANGTGFKMKYPMSDVKNIHFANSTESAICGHLFIQLTTVPSFYIQTALSSGTWISCPDFSEMKQASFVLLHKLTGHALQLQLQLAQITAIEPLKVTGLNTIELMSVPANFSPTYLQQPATGNQVPLVSKSEAQSPAVTGHASVQPEKVRSMSMPTVFTNDNTTMQESSGDDEIFMDMNIPTSAVEEPSAYMWAFPPQDMFNQDISTIVSEQASDPDTFESSPITPCYILDTKEEAMFDDKVLGFASSDASHSSFSSSLSSAPSAIATDLSEFDLENHPLLNNELLMTTSTDLSKMEQPDLYPNSVGEAETVKPQEGSDDAELLSSGGINPSKDFFQSQRVYLKMSQISCSKAGHT